MQISGIPTIACLFSVTLGLDLLSYTGQPYIPSSSEHSLSYTTENCPSHKNRRPASRLIEIFIKSDNDEGAEKHCFCTACDFRRFSVFFIRPSVIFSVDKYRTYLKGPQIETYLKDLTRCTAIRSPPIFFS